MKHLYTFLIIILTVLGLSSYTSENNFIHSDEDSISSPATDTGFFMRAKLNGTDWTASGVKHIKYILNDTMYVRIQARLDTNILNLDLRMPSVSQDDCLQSRSYLLDSTECNVSYRIYNEAENSSTSNYGFSHSGHIDISSCSGSEIMGSFEFVKVGEDTLSITEGVFRSEITR